MLIFRKYVLPVMPPSPSRRGGKEPGHFSPRAYARKIPLTKGSVAAPALPGLRSRAVCLPSALAACRRREEKGEGGTSVPPFSLHTGIHSKQDNCLVLIAPTARWILMRRTDAQSAAVSIKISYFNAYGTKLQALKAKACKADWLCSGARFLDKIVQKPCTFHGSALALPWKYAL